MRKLFLEDLADEHRRCSQCYSKLQYRKEHSSEFNRIWTRFRFEEHWSSSGPPHPQPPKFTTVMNLDWHGHLSKGTHRAKSVLDSKPILLRVKHKLSQHRNISHDIMRAMPLTPQYIWGICNNYAGEYRSSSRLNSEYSPAWRLPSTQQSTRYNNPWTLFNISE